MDNKLKPFEFETRSPEEKRKPVPRWAKSSLLFPVSPQHQVYQAVTKQVNREMRYGN